LPSLRGKRKVQKALEETENRLVAELGGWDKITPQQELLIRSTIKDYGVQLLTELFINKYGPLNPVLARKGVLDYQPIFRAFTSIQNCIRLNLEKLFPGGLERKKADEILDLGRYIEEKYGKPNKEKKEGGSDE